MGPVASSLARKTTRQLKRCQTPEKVFPTLCIVRMLAYWFFLNLVDPRTQGKFSNSTGQGHCSM
jgi:hypothetical protein